MHPASRLFVSFTALVGCTLLAAPAVAQPAAGDDAKKDDKGGEQWTSLSDSPDDPEPPPPPPPEEPVQRSANPYRASEEPPPPAIEAGQGDHGEDLSETTAWMKDWLPHFASSHAELDFEVWSTSRSTSLTWDAIFQVAVGDKEGVGAFDIDIPWAYSTGVGQAMIGNPTLGGHGGGVVAGIVGIWGGGSIGIPTTTQDSSLESLAVNGEAAYVRALVNGHRFALAAVPVRAAFGVEVQIHPFVYFRTEFAPIFFLSTIPNADVQVTMDQVNELEALSPIGLGGGVRFQEEFFFTEPLATAMDNAALALEPYIAYQPPQGGPYGAPVFARVGLLFALNKPLGFGFDRGKVASLRTAVGVHF